MLQSQAFIKTKREAPKDEVSVNAQLLARGSYIDKLTSGVYSFLPLGFRVLANIERVITQEMDAIGGQKMLMPALQPKSLWEETSRWASMDALYKIKDRQEKEFALGPTHEEVMTDIVRKHPFSYRDVPFALYQIQTKFRDELRAKSGILRGREFLMKDLYSFHADEADRQKYYETVKKAYLKIYKRCGLEVIVAEASGGSFSKEISHEFQVATDAGEDIIVSCLSCGFAQNRELTEAKTGDACPRCGKPLREQKAIEVGNIFTLGTRFSQAMKAFFTDKDGAEKPLIMGCYGMGLSRILGTVVEAHHDERGIIWPKEIAPFGAHLIALESRDPKENKRVFAEAKKAYDALGKVTVGKEKHLLEVLYDERKGVSPGQKFADADLIGAPWRIVISEKTRAQGKVELKKRSDKNTKLVTLKNALNTLT